MELCAYPPLGAFGHELRSNLSVLKNATGASGPGLALGPGLASGQGLGSTKDYHGLVISQEDFNRQLLAALVTAQGQGLAKGQGLARIPCTHERCPTLNLPDNIKTLARDLHRSYQVTLGSTPYSNAVNAITIVSPMVLPIH